MRYKLLRKTVSLYTSIKTNNLGTTYLIFLMVNNTHWTDFNLLVI